MPSSSDENFTFSPFVSKMSHDYRNPLNAILGLTEILSSGLYGQLSQQQERSLGHIEESGQRLLVLIERFSIAQRLIHGELTLRPIDVGLSEKFRGDFFVRGLSLSARQVELALDFGGQLGSVGVDLALVTEIVRCGVEVLLPYVRRGQTLTVGFDAPQPGQLQITVSGQDVMLSEESREEMSTLVLSESLTPEDLLQSDGFELLLAVLLTRELGGTAQVLADGNQTDVRFQIPC